MADRTLEIPFTMLGQPAEERPYYLFPTALDKGILEDPVKMAMTPEEPVGIGLLNGRIPSDNAGIMQVGPDKRDIAAVDFGSAEFGDSTVTLRPTSKSTVTSEGEVRDEGVTALMSPEGIFVLLGLTAKLNEVNPWFLSHFAKRRLASVIGERVVVNLGGINFGYRYEVVSQDNNGAIIGKRIPSDLFSTPSAA